MKKILAILVMAALLLTAVGCAGKNTNDPEKGKTLQIGIVQFLSHPSLDNCREGIEQALKASGLSYTVELQIGSNASPDTDCTNFANTMVATGKDMIIAIATPAAKAVFAATADTDIPVIFCAVSDPVAAGLVDTMEQPNYNCSGTSDVLDLEAQVNLIQAMQPEAKTVGVLYTSSEDNSLTNLRNFQTVCDKAGLKLIAKAVQNASDIPTAADELASQVDCINNFTDNNVVNNLGVLITAADNYNVPVYGSEVEQVKNGCLASMSIDYVALGKVTGEMAVEVINGADVSKMPVRTITEATPVVNLNVLEGHNMTMPEAFANAETISQ